MAKRRSIIVVVAMVAIILVAVSLASTPDDPGKQDNRPFHVTLANPEIYQDDGTYQETFEIEPGKYTLKFVPNGDSPEKMTITISGKSVSYQQTLTLEGTPHETGISQYYTWDYLGDKNLQVAQKQQAHIIVDPHGDLLGPVSVSLQKQQD